ATIAAAALTLASGSAVLASDPPVALESHLLHLSSFSATDAVSATLDRDATNPLVLTHDSGAEELDDITESAASNSTETCFADPAMEEDEAELYCGSSIDWTRLKRKSLSRVDSIRLAYASTVERLIGVFVPAEPEPSEWLDPISQQAPSVQSRSTPSVAPWFGAILTSMIGVGALAAFSKPTWPE
ncbi:MAG TPA: hypothetical protein VGW38_07795, partial [Chloroflexota bacterium]|nr:hypothetical protein [Chloroflexota bacterium]